MELKHVVNEQKQIIMELRDAMDRAQEQIRLYITNFPCASPPRESVVELEPPNAPLKRHNAQSGQRLREELVREAELAREYELDEARGSKRARRVARMSTGGEAPKKVTFCKCIDEE